MVLTAMPGKVITGKLNYVSPTITEAEGKDGKRGYTAYFDSEELNGVDQTRLGMTGKAKIYTGRKSLYSIYVQKWKDRAVTWAKMLLS